MTEKLDSDKNTSLGWSVAIIALGAILIGILAAVLMRESENSEDTAKDES
jgi:hypothetical protein